VSDYKATLNLPKTSFPMKANLANREAQEFKAWEDDGLYQQVQDAREGAEMFLLLDGPPYANGDIHIGHAVNKTIKDIIVKSKVLAGFRAPFVPGWDCHGLPIEQQVEKKIGRVGQKVDAEGFRQACREYAFKQVDRQRIDFKRLGINADWDNPYLTLHPEFEADQMRGFAAMIRNGHLQRGSKPVHWCFECRSALAEAEVEYADKVSPAIDVRYRVADEAAFLSKVTHVVAGEGPISLVIWTTTPWTLPASMAVALEENTNYALIEADFGAGTERLLIAEALVDSVVERWGVESHRVVACASGDLLDRVELRHPYLDRVVPIIMAEHVTVDAGTGAVHIAPAHGADDFVAGKKYGLEVYSPVRGDGTFIDSTEYFAGQFIFKANDKIVEMLADVGALVAHKSLEHSYPHCWRHKTPVIFRATPQWFISMDQAGLRSKAVGEIRNVEWIPGWGEERIEGMVTGRPDWCVSRQRTWGVPIALFIHKDSGEPHPDSANLMERAADLVEKGSIDAWFNLESADLLGSEAANYDKVTDILDVWFDSGSVHHCVGSKRPELGLPADLYLEGSDQHRGWFQSSLLTSVAMHGVAPYKQVLTHGFTVDKDGKKMSKSLGNVVAPQKVVNNLGADVLRLWVAATDYRTEMTVSDEILKRVADSYRRLRNTLRFLLSNLDGFDPATDLVTEADMLPLDRWAIRQAASLQTDIQASYHRYEFHAIYQSLHRFCAVDMGGFYLDIIKDRLYTTQGESLARRSAQTAIYHVAEAMVRWLAPISSFTAQEAWNAMPGERGKYVFTESYYPLPAAADEAFSNQAWDTVIKVRDAVSKSLEAARADGVVKAGLDANLVLYADDKTAKVLTAFGDELRFVLISSEATVKPVADKTSTAVASELGEALWIDINVATEAKCERCWHRRPDVGQHAAHQTLCGRCVENIDGSGEHRLFA
jgi:isoleucyl-tRNA synthetase